MPHHAVMPPFPLQRTKQHITRPLPLRLWYYQIVNGYINSACIVMLRNVLILTVPDLHRRRLSCNAHLLHVKMDIQANRKPSELPAECHTRQNVRNNIKSKRKHNISFPQFRAMVNTCSADGDRMCCGEALAMRHWEQRVGRPLSASRILVYPLLV